MKWKQKIALFLLWTSLCLFAPAAYSVSDSTMKTTLPGAEFWEPYLEQSPVDVSRVAEDPLAVLRSFFTSTLLESVLDTVRSYADVLLFLLLFSVAALLSGEAENHALLNLVCTCGVGVLLWEKLLDIAQELCTQLESWSRFLTGFLPVYAGVLQLGGETTAGTAASGFLLVLLCGIAQLMTAFVPPLLECYLALSIASSISSRAGPLRLCSTMGKCLQTCLSWAGRVLAALLGMQRAATVQLDRAALRTGQFLAGTVPIVGQSFSDAAEAVLAGVQLLKSSLGMAAILILLAEFLPLYLGMLVHLGCLTGCGFLCSLTGNQAGETLLESLAQAVRCMMACIGLFFGLAVLGIFLLFGMGGV